ncbi:hypothetical protein LWI28_026939 [Acer negundo]|uniref:Uncharacterized protein n=1 Tax=Acer negundo TaxID=4023 RepID=A0AAD5J1J4_ACENE|nr:hypothetical protein LWI28_026939 [Acer negundo]
MTPDEAYEHVRSIRTRVILAPVQWQAVQEYYLVRVKKACVYSNIRDQAALTRISCMWLHCRTQPKTQGNKLGREQLLNQCLSPGRYKCGHLRLLSTPLKLHISRWIQPPRGL